jgi:hypothetical protein
MSPAEILFIVQDAPEGGYVAQAVGESIFTEADNLEQLHERVRDAVRCHFEKDAASRAVRLHFVRDEVDDVASHARLDRRQLLDVLFGRNAPSASML